MVTYEAILTEDITGLCTSEHGITAISSFHAVCYMMIE